VERPADGLLYAGVAAAAAASSVRPAGRLSGRLAASPTLAPLR